MLTTASHRNVHPSFLGRGDERNSLIIPLLKYAVSRGNQGLILDQSRQTSNQEVDDGSWYKECGKAPACMAAILRGSMVIIINNKCRTIGSSICRLLARSIVQR